LVIKSGNCIDTNRIKQFPKDTKTNMSSDDKDKKYL
jgi:hypothetical protein